MKVRHRIAEEVKKIRERGLWIYLQRLWYSKSELADRGGVDWTDLVRNELCAKAGCIEGGEVGRPV